MKNACRPDWQTEFADQIDDLLHTPAVQNLQYYPHHHRVTRYEHVLLVAQLSFRIARAWGLDSRAVARSALLHDLYHGGKDANYLRHSRTHPLTALHNAMNVTTLSEKEQNIIASHMWPLCTARPQSREAWLVNAVDTLTAFVDVLGCNGKLRKQTGSDRMKEQAQEL